MTVSAQPPLLSAEEEQRAIERARQGDLDAFNRLVDAHQTRAFNTAYRLMGSPEAAADATQEAFLSAHRRLHQFRGGSFRAWLSRIVVNSCYDLLRRAKVRAADSLEAMQEEGQDPVDAGEGPEEGVLRAEQRLALRRCLEGLPADQRAVIVLSDVQGDSYAEMAQALRVSLGTVKSRLSRAREKMRDCLQGSGVLG